MLQIIQIIALTQGLFLLSVLLVKQENYKRVNFLLLLVSIIALLLNVVGDDDFNLFFTDADWYLFQSPLIITLFFLLIKYHNSKHEIFQLRDLLYFTPYLFFITLQIIEDVFGLGQNIWLMTGEVLAGVTLLVYLGYTIYSIIKNKKKSWMLFFILPYALIHLIEEASFIITENYDHFSFLESYGVTSLSAILLYIILFRLVVSPKSLLPKSDTMPYKTSSLSKSKAEVYKSEFLKLMDEQKLFTNSNITVDQVAQKMGIPRQYLSEVLNVYLKSNFQDYMNKCRAEEFVECLKDDKFTNYSIMGIANEVGFKSKSSFNTTFKKIYGVTPSEFKKTLSSPSMV
ncbi:AraC family transcriptional regulator [Flavobacterium sp. MFBS3-15]|uniref:helix-turn-helix domain-containing protein n=1 Tax=Flavobacterium sp. MFBS3-15 TaxID=2989816 RepID=UPI002235E2BE|nr:AraC family transcriptional regulator [Flavobacterium sp. MFBS3-15]MCW4467628.1 AraC family transcriptional regulator [Flavobacterium sp. MFBS3-15]